MRNGRRNKMASTVLTAVALAAAMTVPASLQARAEGYDWGLEPTYYEGTWQEAYLSILSTDYAGEFADTCSFGLIYVDEDEIPEMIVDTNVEAGGNQVFTWHDGMVDKLQTARLGYCYMDRGNLFENMDGNMGNYYDYFYSIIDGRWQEVTSPGNYDPEAMETARYYPKPEMECILETGKTSSVNHRYELVKEQCTWLEAQQKCEQKGGYLATLTCQEEFDKITDAIRSNDMTKYKWYVGASNPRSDTQWGYHWHDPLGEYEMISDTYINYWLTNEPSYEGEDANHNMVDEDCVCLIYIEDGDYFCLNDVAYDLPAQAPYYNGTIGYICEYDW